MHMIISLNKIRAGLERHFSRGMEESFDEDDMLEVISDEQPEDGLVAGIEDLDVEEADEQSLERSSGLTGESQRDDAALCFKGHASAVFSVSISGSVVCSGGEDDIAFVWTTVDGSLLFECQGHKDSVTCTGFSYDGKYVCTADIGGLVQVRGIPTGELIWSTEVGDIEWVQWHSQALVLFAGTSDGGSWMWRIPSGECKTFPGANCRNTCGALLPDGKRLGCGYEDGSVKVWCLKEAMPLCSVVPPFSHSLPVTCVAVHQDNTLVMTGSEDSTAKVINSTNGKVLATLAVGFPKQTAELSGDEASVSEVASSMEAVGFSPVLPLAVTASLSGVLGVWDTSSWTLRHQCHHEAGIVRVHCSSCRPVVYTGSLDGGVRAWDLRAGQCVKEWLGHTDHILDLAVAGDDNILLSASNDNSVRLYSNQI